MRYCNQCLQPDTRPGIQFDDQGVCPACSFYTQSLDTDWDERRKELNALVEFGKKNATSGYDCILGVSGGKDSTRQAVYVKEELKMNPLLVCLGYPPEQVSERGVNNLSNLIKLGFDCVQINPGPKTWKKLMRKSFLEYGNWCKSTELALLSSVPRLAIAYQIPLIWWGENPGLQLGDLKTVGKNGWDGNNLRHGNTIAGMDEAWLLSPDIQLNQVLQYLYPTVDSMNLANLQIAFLGYFWKDWSLVGNATFSSLRGLEIREGTPEEMGDFEGVSALDEDWVPLNQRIKYLKYGFGRTTDYVNEAIRRGKLKREEGIELVKRFDGKCSARSIREFCRYLEITEAQFWGVVDRFVNKSLFYKNEDSEWVPKFIVGETFSI